MHVMRTNLELDPSDAAGMLPAGETALLDGGAAEATVCADRFDALYNGRAGPSAQGSDPVLRRNGFEAVLFDLGDTLVHFETARARHFLDTGIRPAYHRLGELGYRRPGFSVYQRRIKRAFLLGYLFSRLRRREIRLLPVMDGAHRRLGIPLNPAHVPVLVGQCVAALHQFFAVDSDAVQVIRRLDRAGLKLGLVSNTPFPSFAIDSVLEGMGLLRYFPVRVYSSDVGYMKPHRKIFRCALERLAARPERTLYVGDRVDKDVRGAARVGMRAALLVHNGRMPRGAGRADHVVRKLSDLPAILLT